MTFEEIDSLIQILRENEVFNVTISGGESLTNMVNLVYMIKTIKENGLTCTLNTNLSLLNKNKALLLKNSGLDVVLTSLSSIDKKICDSITQTRWSYERIIQGIKEAQLAWIEVGVNTVVYKNNINTLYETGKFVAKLGVPYFAASIWTPPEYDKENKQYDITQESIKYLWDILVNLNKEYGIFVDTITPLPVCMLQDTKKIN